MKAGEGQLPPDPSTVQDAPEDMPPNEDAAEDGHLNPLPEDSSAQNVATMVERGEDWEDDDLDAAINAATQQNPSQPSTSTASAPQPTADADFDDQDLLELDLAQFDADEEALADSAQMSASTSKAPSATKPTSATTSDRPAAEEEDFDFGMDEDILREMEEAEGLVSAHRQEANKDPTSHPT